MEEMDAIKVQWTGDARTKLCTRYIEPRLDARNEDDAEEADIAYETMTRQKTQAVIENEEEANALLTFIKMAVRDAPNGRVWMTGAHSRAFSRVKSELVSELKEREWCGYEPAPETINIDCPDCGKTHAAKETADSVHCLDCGPFQI